MRNFLDVIKHYFHNPRKKIYLVKILFFLLFSIVYVRIFFFQVIFSEAFKKKNAEQQKFVKIIKPYRGKIYTNDKVVLAQSIKLYSAFADPKAYQDNILLKIKDVAGQIDVKKELFRDILFSDKESVIVKTELSYKLYKWLSRYIRIHKIKWMNIISKQVNSGFIFTGPSFVYSLEVFPNVFKQLIDKNLKELAKILNLDFVSLKKLLDNDKRYVWLKRKLTDKELHDLIKYRRKGNYWTSFKSDFYRKYPEKNLSGQVVGFTGVFNVRADGKGIRGVEKSYDYYLNGKKRLVKLFKDGKAGKYVINPKTNLNPDNGSDVYLTVNSYIQYVTEYELKKYFEHNKAKRGCVVVMDPKTGRILAMADYPFFNPNKFSNKSVYKNVKNWCVEDGIEPGSVVKPFIVAGAIEGGLINPNELFNAENGSFKIGGITIHDHEKYDYLDVHNIIKYSSNIGISKIAIKIGKKKLYNILHDFGFGTRTGVDLPYEYGGFLRKWKDWYDADTVNISFGQGFKSTVIQLASAMSVIANGGLLNKPYIVKSIIDKNGEIIFKNIPKIKRRVISKKTAGLVRNMLIRVTEEGGTGTNAAIEGVQVAGKTGTSQKWVDGKYNKKNYVASFTGFLPANNPKWVIAVVIDQPEDRVYGGEAAAPIFKNIGKNLLIRKGLLSLNDDEK